MIQVVSQERKEERWPVQQQRRDADLAGALAYLRAMEESGAPAAVACQVLDDCQSYDDWRYPNRWDK